MTSSEDLKSIGSQTKSRRTLFRRLALIALVLACLAGTYGFYLVFRFHEDVALLQKNKAVLWVNIDTDDSKNVLQEYEKAPAHRIIPGPLLRYRRSVAVIDLSKQPTATAAENDRLFAILPHFHQLECLNLSGFQINTRRTRLLAQIEQLKGVIFNYCQLEPQALEPFRQLNSLSTLRFSGSTFSEQDFQQLLNGPLKETLRYLMLSNCAVTDQSAEALAQCRNLEVLALDGTQISDQTLKKLTGLTQLKFLMLDHTDITDAGVAGLSTLTSLIEISLSNTDISDDILDRLQKNIPDLRISDD